MRTRRIQPGTQKATVTMVAVILTLLTSCLTNAQEHAEGSHHGFSDATRWTKIFESPERTKWQKPDKVVSALKLQPGQMVIDIGAGTGYFTRRFAKAVALSGEALGLDIEPAMIDYMKADAEKLGLKNYHARLVKPDDPELEPHSVDVVFFCDTIHHMDERVAYFRKLASALKPGGRVIVIDFKKEPLPVGPPPEDKLSRDQIVAEFLSTGYRLARDHDFLPYQYFLEFEPDK
jgi:arsenite methyltransferase